MLLSIPPTYLLRLAKERMSTNSTGVCTVGVRALRNAARAQRCTCKFCKRQLAAEDIAIHEQECGEIPLQCSTCTEKIARKHMKDHVCPNEVVTCSCGASLRRKEMERHQEQHCPCLPAPCPLACGLDLARKDIPFHMINCPMRVLKCNVPGCNEETRHSEMVPHKRENVAKHLELYAVEEQRKAWSLKEASASTEIVSKSAVFLTWVVPVDWKWPIASHPIQAFNRQWRIVLTRGRLWLQYFRGADIIRVAIAFFIQKKENDAKRVYISRGHIKLKERRGHGFILPSAFSEGTKILVNCRIIELAAFLAEKP
ncbi:uncharacterized protein [Montipora foliosa]|uniref:uncharacterized protein n=1 Tax=Montipora foliosa TaxID=591990 RepID=UPI0035F18AD7